MYYRYRKMYRLGFCMIHTSNFGNTSQCVKTLAPYFPFFTSTTDCTEHC